MEVNYNKVQTMCTLVRQRFPYSSPWEIRTIQINKLYKQIENQKKSCITDTLSYELEKLKMQYKKTLADSVLITKECSKLNDNPFKYYSFLIDGMDKCKAIWCGAAAKLMYLICRINGVDEKNVERDFVVLDDGISRLCQELQGDAFIPKRLDHVVNKIQTQDGLIEADPLLGTVYREGELHKVLERNFSEALNLPKFAGVKLYSEKKYPIKYNDMPVLNDTAIKMLSERYPELFV